MCSIPSFFYSAVASPIHIVQLNLPLLPSFTYMHTYTNDDDHGHTLILVKKEMLEAPSTQNFWSEPPSHSFMYMIAYAARHKFGSRENGTATCSYCVLKLTPLVESSLKHQWVYSNPCCNLENSGHPRGVAR